ncbi:MAG TPA: TolC family protein [Turneriella sp.]|nr:TolC family protein [Turneriella sp.]
MRYLIYIFAIFISPLVAADAGTYFQIALEKNARLAEEAQLAAATREEHLRESIFNNNPELSVGLMNVPTRTFPAINRDSMSGLSVGISQRLALPWEAHFRKAEAEWRATNAALAVELQKAVLRYDVYEKFNAVLFYTKRAKNLANTKRLIVATLKVLSVPRKDARNIASQILEARASLATQENTILENEYELEKAWLDLSALCGQNLERRSGEDALKAWEDLSLLTLPKSEDITAALLYKKSAQEVNTAEAMASLARASTFPEVTLSASYLFRQQVPGSSMNDDMISVAASTPFPFFYSLKNRHDIAAINNRVEAARAHLLETERQLTAQIAAEKTRFHALVKAAENSTKAILPAHSSAHHSQLTTLNLTGSSAAEALIAYRMYLTADEEHLKQVRDAHAAFHRLHYLLAGGLTP